VSAAQAGSPGWLEGSAVTGVACSLPNMRSIYGYSIEPPGTWPHLSGAASLCSVGRKPTCPPAGRLRAALAGRLSLQASCSALHYTLMAVMLLVGFTWPAACHPDQITLQK